MSATAYDSAVAALRTAQADVAQTRAQVESAKLNLSYTTVTAPIAGRAGRAEVTEGAFVIASSATLLTVIEQLNPVYVNFSQSSSDLLSIRREVSAGTLQVPELAKVEVALMLEDGTRYMHTGHMNFLDLSIDEATGTAAMRAEFPNPDRTLLPGQFVRAQISAGVRPNGILVPQRAVKLAAQGASVLIVDKDNMAVTRDIKVGSLRGGSWIVTAGLEAVIASLSMACKKFSGQSGDHRRAAGGQHCKRRFGFQRRGALNTWHRVSLSTVRSLRG